MTHGLVRTEPLKVIGFKVTLGSMMATVTKILNRDMMHSATHALGTGYGDGRTVDMEPVRRVEYCGRQLKVSCIMI